MEGNPLRLWMPVTELADQLALRLRAQNLTPEERDRWIGFLHGAVNARLDVMEVPQEKRPMGRIIAEVLLDRTLDWLEKTGGIA